MWYFNKSYGSEVLLKPLPSDLVNDGASHQGRSHHCSRIHHLLYALWRHPRHERNGRFPHQVPNQFFCSYSGHATKLKAIVLLGILFASALIHMFHSKFKEFHEVMHMPFDDKASVDATPISHLAVAGLLVGLGTELSNGCTSGHGLCGLPRFSLRSFLAVLFFLSTAIGTATFSLKSHIPEFSLLKLP